MPMKAEQVRVSAACITVCIAAALLLSGCVADDRGAHDPVSIRLGVRNSADIGRYLTDEKGRPVYVAHADSAGVSTCTGPCREVWEPVPASDPPQPSAEPAVQPELVGTLLRADGVRQLAYAKRPLYYRRDVHVMLPEAEPPRSFEDQWGKWSLVFPFGEPMVPDFR
jgi:predicted lipoprotein with Yx(FWY)xxD motif